MTARKVIISFVAVAALAVTASIPAASIVSGASRPVLDRIEFSEGRREPDAAAASVRGKRLAGARRRPRAHRRRVGRTCVGQGGDRGGRWARRAKLATPRPGRRSSRGGSGTAPIGRTSCVHPCACTWTPSTGRRSTASLAPPWHAKNLTGNGVEGGHHRRWIRRPCRAAGGGRPAFERDHAGLLRRPVQHRVGARDGSRRDRPRDGAGSAAVSRSASTPRSISPPPRPTRRPRAPASSATPPRGSARGAMAAARSERSCPTPARRASSGSTRPATTPTPTGRARTSAQTETGRTSGRRATRATPSSGPTTGRSAGTCAGTSGREERRTSTSSCSTPHPESTLAVSDDEQGGLAVSRGGALHRPEVRERHDRRTGASAATA